MLARGLRSSSLFLNPARCISHGYPLFQKPAPSKEQMLTIDWQLEGLVPSFFKGSLGAFFQRMTKDAEFDDQIFGYKIIGPYDMNIHLLKVRAYFRYKSPHNKVEYLGSSYFEGENMLTVLWRLSSLKSNFLRYFPEFITGRKNEYKLVEGALDVYVNSDAQVYKLVNRSATEKDFEEAKQFAELKKQSIKEIEKRERKAAEESY